MKLYHGSPKSLTILKPKKAKGLTSFEDRRAIFLTKTFLHSALYAISKSLKGKTQFGVSPNRLVIVGNHQPSPGYVYELEIQHAIKGLHEQYAIEQQATPIKKTKVYPKDYQKHITYVISEHEILDNLSQSSHNTH